MRIVVYPEKLQELCREFERCAGQMSGIENSLRQAVAGMDWETRRKANIEGSLRSLRNLSSNLIRCKQGISGFLLQKAQAFLEADRASCQAVGGDSLSGFVGGITCLSGVILNSVIASTLRSLSSKNLPEFFRPEYIGTIDPRQHETFKRIKEFLLGETPDQGYEADPVNTALGNYFYYFTDISISTVGPLLHLTRFYNSLKTEDGPLGVGWTFNYGVSLTERGRDVVVNWEDGKRILFTGDGEKYGSPEGGGFALAFDPGADGYVLRTDFGYHYAFSPQGKLLSIRDNNGNALELAYSPEGYVHQVTAASGRWIKFEHDEKGRITRAVDNSGREVSYSYDAEGNLVEVVDPCGNKLNYDYDSSHRLISIRDGLGNLVLRNFYFMGRVAAQVDAEGNMTKYTYYSPGDVVRITDPMGRTKTHVYDDSLRLVAEIDHASHKTRYEYGEEGRLEKVIDRTGLTASYTYDDRGNLLEVSLNGKRMASYEYDADGRLVAAVDGLGRRTEYAYDARSNLISTRNALGGTVRFVLNERGQIVEVIDADGSSWLYEYDDEGNRVAFVDPQGNKTFYEYDDCGRMTAVVRPGGGRAVFTYDECDRITEIVDPCGNRSRFSYDAAGNVLWAEDPNGNRTAYEYTKRYLPSKIIDATGGETRFIYDACGNLKKIVMPSGRCFEYDRDFNGEITKITHPSGRTTEYVRDPEGRLKRVVSSGGSCADYSYDELGRLKETTFGGGSFTRYKYDDVGNLIRVESEGGTERYEYNALNQVISAQYGDKETIFYEYDRSGRLIEMRYPTGKTLGYRYDERGMLESLIVDGEVTARYSYDAAGRCVGVEYANGTRTLKEYDAADRLTRVSVAGTGGDSIMELEYVYDGNGNRVLIRKNGKETRVTYDALDRITGVTYPEGRERRFTYDGDGNIIRILDSEKGEVEFEYDGAGRLFRSGNVSYSYDEDGRLVERITDSATAKYSYDDRGRMVRFEEGGKRVDYFYDEDGLLVSRKDGRGEERFVYDKTRLVPVVILASTDGVERSFYYGRDLTAAGANGLPDLFYHQNGRYDVALVTGAGAETVAEYRYEVFGELLNGEAGEGTFFGFAGELHDADAGLVYLRKRFYDPSIGRFVAEDEFFGFPHIPQSMNPYAYCGNNPLKRIDPLGTSWFEDFKEMGRQIKGGIGVVGELMTGKLSIHEISPYWTESLKDSLQVVEKGLGPLKYIPPVGFGMTWVNSMTNCYLLYYGEVTMPEFLWVQGNNMIDFALSLHGFKGLRYGPGRPPNPFSNKFFTGKRAQATYRWLLEEALDPKGRIEDAVLESMRKGAEKLLFGDNAAKR